MGQTLISVRLPDKLLEAIDKVSKNIERPRTFILRKAIENYLKEYADYQVALDRLNDKEDTIISSQEMRRQVET